MVKQAIQIYLRLRPPETRYAKGEYEISSDSSSGDRIVIRLPKEINANLVSQNKKDNYSFKYCRVFNQDADQDSVFDCVARPVIDNFLKGYNGTIFAYGQTGSGKTFTITGGTEKYSDRGIIPRALTYIFQHLNKEEVDGQNTVQVSYLEIYNENGYDLLDTKHDTAQKLEDLNKVVMFEDSDGNVNLKNMSIHSALNEEEALNLLFIGDTNRMVAETPMNQASTRSHCIFTIHLTARQPGSAVVIKSKLHLVDLAGSERVYKTGVDGLLLTEAKYINLSLHYLEQVIVALAEKNRSHIPYRNSMMTSVLRDSLGGNCMTSMIATISIEKRNLLESISTCKFSQRVALIKNEAILNEAIDPQLIIKQLRNQIDDLRSQLQLKDLPLDWENGDVSEEIIQQCRKDVLQFIESNETRLSKEIYGDIRRINAVFIIMKELYHNAKKMVSETTSEKSSYQLPPIVVPNNPIVNKEVSQLRDIITQRDNEINILVSLLKKAKQEITEKSNGNSDDNSTINRNSTFINKKPLKVIHDSSQSNSASKDSDVSPAFSDTNIKRRLLGDMSVGKEEAFEIFKRDYYLNVQIQTQKDELKEKYIEAKELGQILNDARENTNRIKNEIGRARIQQAISADPGKMNDVSLVITSDEMEFRRLMDVEKLRYKEAYLQLKQLKSVIEHMQHLLETNKVKMVRDFERWWDEQVADSTFQQSVNESSTAKSSATRYPLFRFDKNNTSLPSTGSSNRNISEIPITGDPKVDADVQKFIAARNKLRL